jgi:hypothetical protein
MPSYAYFMHPEMTGTYVTGSAWPKIGYYPGIYLEELRKTKRSI